MASSFFSAASAVLKKTAAAAVDSHVGKTIRSTVDAHNPIAVRRGKFIDPGRLPTSSSPTETGTTISLSTNNDDANTTGSTSTTTSSSTEKQVIDKRRDEYTKWHQVSTPVGTVSVEVHGLRSSEENDDDASTSASMAAAKRLRRGTKFYALVLCEGQRHTTGQLEDLENQASILGAANEQRSKEKDSNEDEEDSEKEQAPAVDLLGNHQCTLDVRDVTSDVFVQIWSTRRAIIDRTLDDDNNEAIKRSEFVGQIAIPLRHLCPSSTGTNGATQMVVEGKMTRVQCRMWPLNPNDAKFQSGISKLQGSAMTKQAPTQRPRTDQGSSSSGGLSSSSSVTSFPGSVELTIMLNLKMPLYKCLVANPPYPIISGVNDPATKHVIDVYYLKKGILRTKALFESEFRILSAFRSLRSWENPLMSVMFLMVVFGLWWRVTNPVWIPMIVSFFLVGCSATTSVANAKRWPHRNINSNSSSNSNSKQSESGESKTGSTSKSANGRENSTSQLGAKQGPIVWEEEVGHDPDNMMAKMKMVHGLIASAAPFLNRWTSRAERLSHAASGEDTMITMLLNLFILMIGVMMTMCVWLFSRIGWNNVIMMVVLLFMTPPSMLSGVVQPPLAEQASGAENDGSHETSCSSSSKNQWLTALERLKWLYARVPDLDEVVHRRMASRQVIQQSKTRK